MANFDKFLDTFVNGDFFIVFLAVMIVILIVLVIALIKTRNDYYELMVDMKENNHNNSREDVDFLSDLKAQSKADEIDEDKPLIKQIDLSSIKTYDSIIDDYEFGEEENAVISAEELADKLSKRTEELGPNNNQEAIAKYEEEQESKAIISYEQLLKNSSNITLTYKEEKIGVGAPKVNKVEVEQKEVVPADKYLAEEEFLQILKEFRTTL